MTKTQTKCLKVLLKRLKLEGCDFSPATEKEVRVYLDTWCVSVVESLIKGDAGDKEAKTHLYVTADEGY